MKRLVLCFDGTWEARPSHRRRRGGHYPTNVEKTHIAIAKQDGLGQLQITSYYRGIGSAAIRYWPGLTGHGISEAICNAYAFIADNFDLSSDELYLFGFSRGAYTARSLCGFMQWVGILKKERLSILSEAYRQYRLPESKRDNQFRGDALQSLRKRETGSFPVRFLGVWDTVGSVGLPIPLVGRLVNRRWAGFHDVALTPNVTYAFQALAIHERRAPFSPEIWKSQHLGQTVEQAWFAGTHADVGGGNSSRHLSDIALLWLICKAETLGLAFDRTFLANTTSPKAEGGIYNSSGGVWRFVRRHNRAFGQGIDECFDASVPLHIAHHSQTKRRRAWRRADESILHLTQCNACNQGVITPVDSGRDQGTAEFDPQAEVSVETLKKIKEYRETHSWKLPWRK